ncbi:MAG: hypothetical protein HYV02_05465 [Deltaproteobacteria bacterium]|nr:hypothetical protein [Deltaproteobacteria bacterium]
MRGRRRIFCLLLCAVVGGVACGSEQLQGEDYGDLLVSPSGLVLTQDEHAVGWGKSDCTLCHNFNNLHLVDQTNTGINVTAIQDLVFSDGLDSCAVCHGTNGVE